MSKLLTFKIVPGCRFGWEKSTKAGLSWVVSMSIKLRDYLCKRWCHSILKFVTFESDVSWRSIIFPRGRSCRRLQFCREAISKQSKHGYRFLRWAFNKKLATSSMWRWIQNRTMQNGHILIWLKRRVDTPRKKYVCVYIYISSFFSIQKVRPPLRENVAKFAKST